MDALTPATHRADAATERTLTELDHLRLQRLVGHHRSSQSDADDAWGIGSVLDAAETVPSCGVSPDVVTMYSLVELADLASGRRHRVTLCYPRDAEPSAGFVSVLSPVGASLIGLHVGAVAHWRLPSGQVGTAEVAAVLFQPEASGDYTS